MYRLLIANKNYSSWSLRAWVVLAELGVDFEEQLLPFAGDDDHATERRAATPAGKVPCLIDGSGPEPVTVWDSLAIAEYLAERHPGVWPEDPVARAWARCAAAEMHSGFPRLRSVCSMNCGVTVQLHEVPRRSLDAELARVEQLWNEGLDRFGGPFLAGDRFTAVDAAYCPIALRLRGYSIELGKATMAYADRLIALPSMQRWITAGLAETWRDREHEEEWQQVGTLVEDRRATAD